MAESGGTKRGNKTRKHGRKKRSSAQMRYNQSRRWETNKLNRAKRTAKKFGYPVKVKIDGEMITVTG